MSAATAPERGWKSEKVDEAQALARSCAARRPDFQPCDGLSICATHSHGKCFKLHWCCHLGWCHCKWSRVGLRSPACGPALPGRREEIPEGSLAVVTKGDFSAQGSLGLASFSFLLYTSLEVEERSERMPTSREAYLAVGVGTDMSLSLSFWLLFNRKS